MKSSYFYKKILSVKIPIFLALFGIWFIFYAKNIKDVDTGFLSRFIFLYIALILIIESIIAFFRTLKLLQKSKSRNYNLKFKLLVLPYLPAILGKMLFCIVRIIEKQILYKTEFIITLGITLLINFTFSLIYNLKVKIFDRI